MASAGDGVGLGVLEGVALPVAVGMAAEVSVGVGVEVAVGLAVGVVVLVGVGMLVGVGAGAYVDVGVGVAVGVAVGTTLGCAVAVGMTDGATGCRADDPGTAGTLNPFITTGKQTQFRTVMLVVALSSPTKLAPVTVAVYTPQVG